MPYDPQRHHRRSIRLPGYDYRAPGAYFVTICTEGRLCVLGEIVSGVMHPNALGRIVIARWNDIPTHHPQVELDAFQLMPNHVHCVIRLAGGIPDADMGGPPRLEVVARGPVAGSVGAVVGGFKSAVSREINRARNSPGALLWQRDFFEHVIRHDESLSAIRVYVQTNPQRWDRDAVNPDGTGEDEVESWVRDLERRVGSSRNEAARAAQTAPGDRDPVSTNLPPPGRATQASPLPGGDLSDQRRATQASPLLGHGYDLHRLQPGGPLVLAGVVVADDVRPVAHSDGDVVLHAVVDALLGAMGWGDIGELFSNDDPRWKGAASRVFVEDVIGRVHAAGYVVGNCDVTVLAERPKLKPFKLAMRASLAGLLRVPEDRVNIKAGTNEGCDAVGRGEAVAAHAVVMLVGARPASPSVGHPES